MILVFTLVMKLQRALEREGHPLPVDSQPSVGTGGLFKARICPAPQACPGARLAGISYSGLLASSRINTRVRAGMGFGGVLHQAEPDSLQNRCVG